MSEKIETPAMGEKIEYVWYPLFEVMQVISTGERTKSGCLMVITRSGLGSFGGEWRYPGEKEWRR